MIFIAKDIKISFKENRDGGGGGGGGGMCVVGRFQPTMASKVECYFCYRFLALDIKLLLRPTLRHVFDPIP